MYRDRECICTFDVLWVPSKREDSIRRAEYRRLRENKARKCELKFTRDAVKTRTQDWGLVLDALETMQESRYIENV